MIPKPPIPLALGESVHRALAAGAKSPLFLSAGRWTLSSKAMVPYASVEVPQYGGREITWGETIEIPAGSQGVVSNTSAHRGDVIFAAAGSGEGFVGAAPAVVAIPCSFAAGGGGAVSRTKPVDTRRARRCYLCAGTSSSVTNGQITFGFRVIYQADKRGLIFDDASVGPPLQYDVAAQGYRSQVPLGYGSGQVVDSSGNSVPELRPMCLFDSLFLQIDANVPGQGGQPAGTNFYYLLEY